jgi:IclR family acetate operon transcriptional repressor
MLEVEGQPYGGSKTVEKSLRILELLLSERGGLSIGEIGRLTDMHRASVHRLLTSLHTLGWVERPSERPVYRISLRLYGLAHVFVKNYNVVERLTPLLLELCGRSRETIHLGMLDGLEVLHIARQESPERVGVASRIGSRGWAHTSGMGKALLAAQPDAAVEQYIAASGLPRMTEHSIAGAEAFRAEMARTRARGFSIDNEEDSIGVRCLGATVPSVHGAPVLAVSITGPSPRFTLDQAMRFAPVLLDLVAQVDVPELAMLEAAGQ